MVDPPIIELVKKGENEAFKLMYQRCISYVYAIVRRFVTNESEHPDVIQEIFARVFISVGTFDATKGDFKFWLRRLAINQCFRHYRQGKSPRLYVSIDAAEEIETDDFQFINEISIAEIEKYLSRMPEGYRQVFMLVIMDEYSHKEVGELLGISAETSRSQLSRAKSWLRKNILNSNKQKFLVGGL